MPKMIGVDDYITFDENNKFAIFCIKHFFMKIIYTSNTNHQVTHFK